MHYVYLCTICSALHILYTFQTNAALQVMEWRQWDRWVSLPTRESSLVDSYGLLKFSRDTYRYREAKTFQQDFILQPLPTHRCVADAHSQSSGKA